MMKLAKYRNELRVVYLTAWKHWIKVQIKSLTQWGVSAGHKQLSSCLEKAGDLMNWTDPKTQLGEDGLTPGQGTPTAMQIDFSPRKCAGVCVCLMSPFSGLEFVKQVS